MIRDAVSSSLLSLSRTHPLSLSLSLSVCLCPRLSFSRHLSLLLSHLFLTPLPLAVYHSPFFPSTPSLPHEHTLLKMYFFSLMIAFLSLSLSLSHLLTRLIKFKRCNDVLITSPSHLH